MAVVTAIITTVVMVVVAAVVSAVDAQFVYGCVKHVPNLDTMQNKRPEVENR